jgi:hypothetical protein
MWPTKTKNNHMKKLLSLLTIVLLVSMAAHSQAPGIFNYQGVARNSVGNVLANKTITLRLTLRDLTAAGAVVYQESRTVVTNPFGLFNVQVGSPGASNVTGTIAGVNWGVGAKFIQVEIDPNGGVAFINIGTAQLASVPYAWYATVAGDLVLPFIKTQAASGTTLIGLTNSATTGTQGAFTGTSASTDGNAFAITGTISSASPGGFSAGVRGINNGTGGLGIGVYGSQNGSGWGVYGITPSGIGVNGASTSGVGVNGSSTSGTGGRFTTTSGLAIHTTGGVRLQGINEGLNRILGSDAAGNANWFDPSLLGLVTGSGTLNFVPKWTPNGTNLGNSNIFDNGTNVGVFTTAPTARLHSISTAGTGTTAAILGESNSQDANAVAVGATITSTAPGGFSAALRGTNNGTGGLGIGVYGSQAGSGWGVYGVTPTGIGVYGNATGSGFGVYGNSSSGVGVTGTSNTGHAGEFSVNNAASTGDAVRANQAGLGRGVYSAISNTSNIVAAVRGETNGGGYGIFGQATGNGNAGFFQISNPASTSSTMNVTTNGIGSGVTVQLTNASNGARGVDVLQAGVGPGVFATSAGGNAVWGITSSISAAGVIGDNTFGEAVVGRNRGGNGVGAVVGRNDSTGYGVRGFNTKDGIGVLGQAGISGGTGRGGVFQNVNAANTSTTVEVATNGIGGGIKVDMTNASNGARGIDVNHTGVGPAGFAVSQGGMGWWGITSSISAAGILGDNTFGEAVVGRNRGGNGVGAVVGRNDSTGYGVRGFNTKDGIGVLGQAGISGGTGRGGRFENVNAANSSNVVEIAGNGTGASLLVHNSNGGATNLAIFRKNAGNVVRIADNGEIFANGGFTVGGADVAELFAAEGSRSSYEPGDVLVISQTSDRKIEKSSTPYSTLVSGVYATKPGMQLTEENAVDGDLSQLVPMGVIGVLPTKVCLEGGAIKRGDLLVTSSIAGVAMKADPDKVKVGQVLGKALQDYNANEVGKINVLVSVK